MKTNKQKKSHKLSLYFWFHLYLAKFLIFGRIHKHCDISFNLKLYPSAYTAYSQKLSIWKYVVIKFGLYILKVW